MLDPLQWVVGALNVSVVFAEARPNGWFMKLTQQQLETAEPTRWTGWRVPLCAAVCRWRAVPETLSQVYREQRQTAGLSGT